MLFNAETTISPVEFQKKISLLDKITTKQINSLMKIFLRNTKWTLVKLGLLVKKSYDTKCKMDFCTACSLFEPAATHSI